MVGFFAFAFSVLLLIAGGCNSANADEGQGDGVKLDCLTTDGDRLVFKSQGNVISRCNKRGKNCYEQTIVKKETAGDEQLLYTTDNTITRLSYTDMDGIRLLAVAWRSSDPDWVSPNNTSNHDDLFFCGK
jgi:hypothetical protein